MLESAVQKIYKFAIKQRINLSVRIAISELIDMSNWSSGVYINMLRICNFNVLPLTFDLWDVLTVVLHYGALEFSQFPLSYEYVKLLNVLFFFPSICIMECLGRQWYVLLPGG